MPSLSESITPHWHLLLFMPDHHKQHVFDVMKFYALQEDGTFTIEQAVERAGTKAGNKGGEAAASTIEMVNLLRQL